MSKRNPNPLRPCALAALAVAVCAVAAPAQPPGDKDKDPKAAKVGVTVNAAGAFKGYTLIAPLMTNKAYLIDMEGRVVNQWTCPTNPAASTYFLENGNLLRTGVAPGAGGMGKGLPFPKDGPGKKDGKGGWGPAAGGRVLEYSWDGKLVWDFTLASDKQQPHHDICKLPGGNVLMVVWDRKSRKEALAAGRNPALVGDYLIPDSVLEIKPDGPKGGKVVWEWHLWDHLIQDHDKSKANYGAVAERPELVDINFVNDPLAKIAKGKDGDKLKGLGYVGTTGKQRVNPDWTHVNSVAYNADLDQIALTVHAFSEVWVIDHSTTTAEAAGHKGGKSGKGGDLLYRWGNPRAYRAGTHKDQKFFSPHNAHWIPKGLPGAGNLIIFNNGPGRPGGNHSSVEELVLPFKDGAYERKSAAFGPDGPTWSYTAPKKTDFYASFISGAHRLENGNTLICSGPNGVVFEVTPKGETVWNFINPTRGGTGGPRPPVGPKPPDGVELLPGFATPLLSLDDKQKKEISAFDKSATEKLNKILSEDQQKQLKGARGAGGPALPGQVLTDAQAKGLKLGNDQKEGLAELQKEADDFLDKTLKEGQKKQVKDMRERIARGGPPTGGPGPAGMFRAYRFGPKFAGLEGKELKPGKRIEELEAPKAKDKK